MIAFVVVLLSVLLYGASFLAGVQYNKNISKSKNSEVDKLIKLAYDMYDQAAKQTAAGRPSRGRTLIEQADGLLERAQRLSHDSTVPNTLPYPTDDLPTVDRPQGYGV